MWLCPAISGAWKDGFTQDTHDIIPKELLGKIHRAVMRKLGAATILKRDKEQWGVVEMRRAVKRWREGRDSVAQAKLLENGIVAEFVRTAMVS